MLGTVLVRIELISTRKGDVGPEVVEWYLGSLENRPGALA